MNWNSHEFIWLDWTILAVGIVAVIWAVWRLSLIHISEPTRRS